jgi:hypothetical protein
MMGCNMSLDITKHSSGHVFHPDNGVLVLNIGFELYSPGRQPQTVMQQSSLLFM